MHKQSQNIIKKGDYYEYEPIEQIMPSQSKLRKEDNPIISSTNIPVSEYICNQIPAFKDARTRYFFNDLQKQYQERNIHELGSELYQMLIVNNEVIKDEDRKSIQQLIEEIQLFKNYKQLSLLELKKEENIQVKQVIAQNLTINLTAKYDLTKIQNKISKLEELDFPELQNLQYQLEVMIGQKKPLSVLEPLPKDYQKDQINNIYNHLNNLQILNSINLTIDKITLNEEKHVEMKNWVEKNQKITALNHDFLIELKEDEELLTKLEINFKQNIQQVRVILNELKQ